MWLLCVCMCYYVMLCCIVFHFISASLPIPVNASSASVPNATSTSAPGCVPSSTRPSIASSVPLPTLPRSWSPRPRPLPLTLSWMDPGQGQGRRLGRSLPGRYPHPPRRPRWPHHLRDRQLRGLLERHHYRRRRALSGPHPRPDSKTRSMTIQPAGLADIGQPGSRL